MSQKGYQKNWLIKKDPKEESRKLGATEKWNVTEKLPSKKIENSKKG